MKLLRRGSALLLALLLLAAPARADAAFSDVPEDSWAYESICRAAQLGLIGGVGGGKFGYGMDVTRAQYAMMLCRLMEWEMLTPAQGSFDDNSAPSAWYYSAIETACAHGAILKLGRECRPEEPLAREEMAFMTLRALGYGDGVLAGIVQNRCPFTDVTSNRGYITLACHMRFMGGTGGTRFSPKAVSKREQAAAVLLRVYDRLHAEITISEAVPEDVTAVSVEPLSLMQGSLPLCPRAAVEQVYAAGVEAGTGGAVVLHTAPWAVTNGELPGEAITREQLEAYLASSATSTSRSTRYASSYLTNGNTIVWYETQEDIAAKVELCRLLGISVVYIVD